MSIWPGENDWEGSRKAGGDGSEGSDTRGSGTHWLAQVTAYLEVSGILGVQLVPGVDEGIQGKLGLAKGGDKTMIRLRMLESNYRSLKKR